MRTLVIGASGHLGAHLTRALLAEGHPVRAMVRPTSDLRGLAGLDVEVIRGDVRDPASLAQAMRGCPAVFHLGAPTSLGPDLTDIIEDGTRNVAEQALRLGVEKLIYTSSIVTVGYATDPTTLLDESANQLSLASPYHAAKWRAEQYVLDFGRTTGLPVVAVNPATVVGPLDYRVTPSNLPIQRCLDKGLPFCFDSGLTVVHAADVARGHHLALLRGTPGQRYILGGDRITIPDYFKLICALCRRPGHPVKIPRWAMLGLGMGFSGLHRLGLRNVPFTYGQASQLVGKYGYYSSAKAVRDLGYSWRPVADAVAAYVEWVVAGRGEKSGAYRAAAA